MFKYPLDSNVFQNVNSENVHYIAGAEAAQRALADRQGPQAFCIHCNKGFQSKTQLKTHVKRSHAIYCNVCSINIQYISVTETAHGALLRHSELPTHKERCGLFCRLCDLAFTEDTDYREHRNRTHVLVASAATEAESKNYCWPCHRAFKNKKEFCEHKISFHTTSVSAAPAVPGEAYCDVCSIKIQYIPRTRTAQEALLRHNILPMHQENCSQFCWPCHKAFSTKNKFREHRNRTHVQVASAATEAESKNYCWPCHKAFQNEKEFRGHEISFHTTSVSAAPAVPAEAYCDVCSIKIQYMPGTETAQEALLRHYMDSIHRKNVGLFCQLCNLKFATKIDYREHRNRTHVLVASAATEYESKNYCWPCHKAFGSNTKFREHNNRTHVLVASAATEAESKNYCWPCHKAFGSNNKFRQHKNRTHVLDAPAPTDYRCCDCSITFSSQKMLYKHLKICSTIQRGIFVCEPCNVMCGSRAELVTHLASSEHKPVKCAGSAACKRTFKSAPDMLQHLESGACVSKIDRAKINALVQKNDTQNTIMIAGAQLMPTSAGGEADRIGGIPEAAFQAPAAYEVFDADNDKTPCLTPRTNPVCVTVDDQDEDDDIEGVLLTPGTSAAYTPPSTLSGTSTPGGVPIYTPAGTVTPIHNSSGLIYTPSTGLSTPSALFRPSPPTAPHPSTPRTCAICCKTFKSASGAKAHMLSAVHAPKIYYCSALNMGENGGHEEKRFKTLSSLVLHVSRSEGCGGGEAVQKLLGLVQDLAAGGMRLQGLAESMSGK
ncbi:hypothetical protein EDC01DRAFT_629319 [Geopyxis carbonaria]|nr:hypothetical protein EDC01DRAFT_629319 [Geopyxis carbonaria]